MEQFFNDIDDIDNNNDNNKKLISTRVSKSLRMSIWDMYAGPNKIEIKCMMCRRQVINRTQTRQWEAGHIVAQKFHTKKPCRYDLIPICPACNNQCSDICILDFLYGIERYDSLSRIIRSIYKAFREENPEQFQDEFDSEAWKVLQHLYDGLQFRIGGGLQNKRHIYNFTKELQCQDEWEIIAKYTKKIKASNEIIYRCSKRVKLKNVLEF